MNWDAVDFKNLIRGVVAGYPAAEDEFQHMLQNRPTVRQQIVSLLRQGLTYRQIADHLNTAEKNIWRLVRRSHPEAHTCLPS